jgi:hypothetical protein
MPSGATAAAGGFLRFFAVPFRISWSGRFSIVAGYDGGYDPTMSTLVEIESAAKQLPESDRQRLLISLMQSLRLTSQPLPVPRLFSIEEMQGWMDEDEADLKTLRGHG